MFKQRFEVLCAFLLLLLLVAVSCKKEESRTPPATQTSRTAKIPPTFVGAAKCAECHRQEYERWMGSDHQLAMQPANEKTVLGNFSDASFRYNGITTLFYRRDQKFFVRTDGPEGKLQDYEIRYTFGVRPLQQYLIEFPGGRYQALDIAWDSRTSNQGGDRWLHLHPTEKVDYRDFLHWTGLYLNWNHMCADCHSTNLKKNYDEKLKLFSTSWSEINVACEACHGPGSQHVALAKEKGRYQFAGELADLKPRRTDWTMDPNTGNPLHKDGIPQRTALIEMCAQCHSRRSQISDRYHAGMPLTDAYMPTLLEDTVYYPDGQIKEEDYEYASFLQSKMFQQGVECISCHEVHTMKLVAPGNAVCAQCHTPAKYDSPAHHFHKIGSAGVQCVECHMPTQMYMVVDARRDHSMRIPRPDLSERLGAPNACNHCHRDKSTKWAAQSAEKWWGLSKKGPHYGEIIHDARNYRVGADRELVQLAQDQTSPVIVRATAIHEMGAYAESYTWNAIASLVREQDPLIRLAALDALESASPEMRWQLGSHLLKDRSLSVRIRAAEVLREIPQQGLQPDQKASLQAATQEFLRVQEFSADRPEAHLNRGNLFLQQGKFQEAESEYQAAIQLQPAMVQPYVNLADLYRVSNREKEGERILRKALSIQPSDPDVQFALGLLLVRQKRLQEALPFLADAAKNSERHPRYAYVYAVALNSAGQSKRAISVLESAHLRFPAYTEILIALVQFSRDAGEIESARRYAEELVRISPDDPSTVALLRQIEAAEKE